MVVMIIIYNYLVYYFQQVDLISNKDKSLLLIRNDFPSLFELIYRSQCNRGQKVVTIDNLMQ